MFSAFAKDGRLTHYELTRLKNTEQSDRLMSVTMETVDLILQIVFTVVMFHQAGTIAQLPLEWVWVQATVGQGNAQGNSGQGCAGAPAQDYRYFQLGLAAALSISANMIWRAALAIIPIATRSSDAKLQGAQYIKLAYGLGAAIVDPWNGALILEEVLGPKKGVSDYLSLKREIAVDISLLVTESLPMFAIHVSYAIIAGRVSAVSVSWFLSVTISSLHLLSQVFEIITLIRQLPMAQSDTAAVMVTIDPNNKDGV